MSHSSTEHTLSVIIPVFKEQDTINTFIRDLTEIFPLVRHQIIVVDGSPDQETLAALDVSGVIGVTADKGRGKQMNFGASLAKGHILLFLHADTSLPVNAPQIIKAALNDKNIVGGSFSLCINSSRWFMKIIEKAANLRSSFTRVPYGDQAIFIRRVFFEKMGGFRDISIMEDLDLMTRIRKSGNNIVILQDKAMTSPRRWEQEGILRCTLRNWLIRTLYHCGVSAEKIARMYK